ncbi:MAG: redoxin domain-containing protein [Acidimicrobiia bacterium]|nr:redoxin domain-containing protein [Acidimicrobiia bacterium]
MIPLTLALLLAAAPADVTLHTLDGEPRSFTSLRGGITVVVFISAVCPMSNDYADRFSALHREYANSAVRLLFVNSNRTEPVEQIRRNAEGNQFPFPVLRDTNNALADHFQAQVTPTAVVLDNSGAIRYQGAFDAAANPARVKRQWVREAVEALRAGKPVAVTSTKPEG